jgi:transposase InsO family protein
MSPAIGRRLLQRVRSRHFLHVPSTFMRFSDVIAAILRWSQETRVEWHYIAPGKPQQNAFIESFSP